jgi:hypothetical protein
MPSCVALIGLQTSGGHLASQLSGDSTIRFGTVRPGPLQSLPGSRRQTAGLEDLGGIVDLVDSHSQRREFVQIELRLGWFRTGQSAPSSSDGSSDLHGELAAAAAGVPGDVQGLAYLYGAPGRLVEGVRS